MTILFTVAFAALGAVLASFTAVISERIYTGQSWLKGRSRCNSCRRQLNGFDLVPVLSWIVFRGRCRTCHARVPVAYVLFEASLAVCFALGYLTLGLTIQFAVFILTLLVLGFIVLYDLRHMIVPFESSILVVILATVFDALTAHTLYAFWMTVMIALVIGLGFFLLYFLSKGRAMGLGDAPVAFALSLFVGTYAFSGLLFSFWIGAVVGIVILVMRRGGPRMGIEVPFVPFLALGYVLAYFIQWNPFFL